MDILIIDDDDVDRMSVTRTLNSSDLNINKVDQTSSAKEGVQLALKKRYDVILLDYQLPPSNGIEVLKELRGNSNFSTSIVMLSHSNDEDLALKCIEVGAQDFIMKSEVTITRLKRAILLSSERHNLEQKINESHDQLKQLAEQDSLTGLSNRYFFDESLKDAIPMAKRNNSQFALILLDLDNFKNINDTFGHIAGDNLLVEVARRLERPIRGGDRLCRLGGDEFAILVHDLDTPYSIRPLIDRILNVLSKPVEFENNLIDVTASIGIALYPSCASDAVGLMKCADVAMYRAKDLGRNQAQYYAREFHERIEKKVQVENDLKSALINDQLVLYYQPHVDAINFNLVSVEVLIRWNHPEKGLILPDDFLHVAEEAHCLNEIGRWVLETACQQFSSWLNMFNSEKITFSIAMNFSSVPLDNHVFIAYIKTCMQRFAIPMNRIELIFTESDFKRRFIELDTLRELSESGVTLALDGFGSGSSSLSSLTGYPFHILKIDKSLVQHTQDEEQANLLKAICSFAHSLNYEIVAGGIETQEQQDRCLEYGVKRLQGYLYSYPLLPHELEKKWIKKTS